LGELVAIDIVSTGDLATASSAKSFLQQLQGYPEISSAKYTSNVTSFEHVVFYTRPQIYLAGYIGGPNVLDVFVIDSNYRSEIDYQGNYFLVDITPNCVETDWFDLESCRFETIPLKRMPTEKLVISFSELCLALAEKRLRLEPSVLHNMRNSRLEILVEVDDQQKLLTKRKHIGQIFVNLQQHLTSKFRNEEIIFELETLMTATVENRGGFLSLQPMPVTIDDDTELVILLPDVTVRPVKFTLDRFIHSYKRYNLEKSRFILAFECYKGGDRCLPNLTFVLFDYNVEKHKLTFPRLEIFSQGANYRLVRS